MNTIDRLSAEDFPDSVEELAALLAETVGDGASMGFLNPFDQETAAVWWKAQAPAVAEGASPSGSAATPAASAPPSAWS
nr:hypothetical protein GCM10020093_016640 [Planobispora longispora]